MMQREGAARLGRARARTLREEERLSAASWAFTTRRVPRDQPYRISPGPLKPSAGDLVLARVDALGHHRGLQLATGRRKHLFPGDEIVVAYGNRYAANQFEAVVPQTIGPCHLVAGGGVAAKALSWHGKVSRGPSMITPIGLLTDRRGRPVNLAHHAIEPIESINSPLPVAISVIGTGMDAGKTTSAAFLVRGLTQAGLKVGFAKITGTGAGGDTWLLTDAGADPVLDFTDAGHVSTYKLPLAAIEKLLVTLTGHLVKAGVEVIVFEVADGVLQPETAALLDSPVFKAISSASLFAAGDAMGAMAGAQWLTEHEHPVVGLSGLLTASPLQRQEAANTTRIPTYDREELADAATARRIVQDLEPGAGVRTGAASVRPGNHRMASNHA